MPSLSPESLEVLTDRYGPVEMEFTIKQTPKGGAPEDIKEQWIGVSLPLREANLAELIEGGQTRYLDLLTNYMKDNEQPVGIVGLEAVHALREAERDEAANFWAPYAAGLFVFRAFEGTLQKLELDK